MKSLKLKQGGRELGRTISLRLPELSAVILTIAIGTLGWLIWEYRRTVDLVVHTVAVERCILEVVSAVHDAESGSNGYIMTGAATYLQQFDRAAIAVKVEASELQGLARDAEAQAGYQALQKTIDASFRSMKVGRDLRRSHGVDAAIAFIRSGETNLALEKVRLSASDMTNIEAKLYLSRVATVQKVTLAGGLTALLALLVTLTSMTLWIQNRRDEARDLLKTLALRDKNEAQIRQMQKIEAVGQLSGGLAHDLNNMLAVIISGLSLIDRRLAAGDTDVTRFTSAAMDGATRAATLTSRLMAFSRQLPLAPQLLDANQLIRDLIELLQRTLGETVQTQTDLEPELWVISADSGQLENAILNLAVNGRDAMPDGGTLTLETRNHTAPKTSDPLSELPEGHYVALCVRDSGHGMTAEVIAKAFEPFFTTKGIGKGTGLGLSQVYGFIKQSGGHISIESSPGEGAAVFMFLPRHQGAEAKKRSRVENRNSWFDSKATNSEHVILVVEDEDRVREMSVLLLRELGYTVIQADGAASAMEQIEAHPEISVLFTDIVMPETNGRQLAAKVLERRPDIKVLYTTGFTRDIVMEVSGENPDSDLIAKPFTFDQIARKMASVVVDRKLH
jgi:signal transduction histidine kinase/CheY-like chemotaxis protein